MLLVLLMGSLNMGSHRCCAGVLALQPAGRREVAACAVPEGRAADPPLHLGACNSPHTGCLHSLVLRFGLSSRAGLHTLVRLLQGGLVDLRSLEQLLSDLLGCLWAHDRA